METVEQYTDTVETRVSKPEVSSDRQLVAIISALLALSIVMVFSATIAINKETLQTNYGQLIKHLINIGLGVGFMLIAARIQLNWLQSSSKILLAGVVLMIIILFVPGVGVEVNSSIRWIELAGVRFQPAELLKIVVIIYFADYLSRKRDDLHRFKVGILNVGVIVGSLSLLLLTQPDFGTTVVIVATVGAMLFLGGVSFWHLFVSALISVVLMIVVILIEPYRVARVLSFRDPWADPFGGGFQLVQALIAIGRGEWFGVGLGNSIQKLFYLPHAGNDFIISIIAEELGAVGMFFVLLLYTGLLFKIFSIARKALQQGNRFSGFLGQGIGILITIQSAIHIGVNTGLLPTKGLTLPLLSYGGSSMLCLLFAIGLVFAIDRQNQTPRSQTWSQ